MTKVPFKMEFDLGTIKHLGLQMYSTLPPVIGELVSNAWDADASAVHITIPEEALTEQSEIIVWDQGRGMTDEIVRNAYLVVGRDRREAEGTDVTSDGRPVMGRKGIGKFSAFGIAGEIEVETFCNGNVSRFVMNYEEMKLRAANRNLEMDSLPPTGNVEKGTRITLRKISKFRKRAINIVELRRGLARRFSIIGKVNGFQVFINGQEITQEERDLQRLLEVNSDNEKYIWEYKNTQIGSDSDLTVSGWIGALKKSSQLEDGIQRGIVLMARGKMVQEPFVFDAEVGQQFALSYLVGELNAEFVDTSEDTISTTRNSLVWDTENNKQLLKWGQQEVNKIARQWAERRSRDNEKEIQANPIYQRYVAASKEISGGKHIKKIADELIRKTVTNNPLQDSKESETVVQLCIDFMEFDSFQELASELDTTGNLDITRLVDLFRRFEVMEAKEMMRVTEQRIKTIDKLQKLIEQNALEVPTLHNFLREFPWVIDPRWTLVANELTYSQLLKKEFPEEIDTLEINKRIDFLCVKESTNLVIVEIKRPNSTISKKELAQIEEYVGFIRDYCSRTSDPEMKSKEVFGYILCGSVVDTAFVRERVKNLENSKIYVRKYMDLLTMVVRMHKDFLERYSKLKALRQAELE